MTSTRWLTRAAALVLGVLTACAPQPLPRQPAATEPPVLEVAIHRVDAVPDRPAAAVVDAASDGGLQVTRTTGPVKRLGDAGAVWLSSDSTHVVWVDPCTACDATAAAVRRGLHVYDLVTDRDVRLLADRLPRFNEVQLGSGRLAVLLPSVDHANAAVLRVFDLDTGVAHDLSTRTLAVGGAMQPLLALQDGQVAWVDVLGTTRDLALRVWDLAAGRERQPALSLAEVPEALVVSRALVAWRAGWVWRGVDLASGAAWEAPVGPDDLGPGDVLAVSDPHLVERRLFWSLATAAGASAWSADVP